MKTFMQFLNSSSSEGSAKDLLQNILALLHALHWNYNSSHWQAKGDNYYGNHLLFQRLYEAIPAEYDGLAEKIVAYFGAEAVNQKIILEKSKKFTDKWDKNKDAIKRSIEAEQDLQKAFKGAYEKLKKDDDISLGLDDFLMATANAHETNLYLLGQASK